MDTNEYAVKGIESDLRERVTAEGGTLIRVMAHYSDHMNQFFGTGLSYTYDVPTDSLAQTIWKFDGGWLIREYIILTDEEEKIIANIRRKKGKR